jgi:hypothetical protein
MGDVTVLWRTYYKCAPKQRNTCWGKGREVEDAEGTEGREREGRKVSKDQ